MAPVIGVSSNFFKLVDFGPRVVADADHLVDQIRRRDIDHAFLALADE